jgi:uncharacterized coiled-coil protein SlyX
MDVDDRTTGLEIKVAYLEKQLADLDGVVREQADALDALKLVVERLQARVAQEQEAQGEILGAHPEQDPVPRSG